MIKFIYPVANCTMYSNYEILNTGADEIIEIASEFTPSSGPMIARTLIKFSDEDIFTNYKETNSYILNLKVVKSIELSETSELEVFPVTQEWDAGVGRFADKETTYPGASWLYRNEKNDSWDGGQNQVEFDQGGGSWFYKYYDTELEIESELDMTYSFNKVSSDVKIDITKLVDFWNANAIENNGMILKFKDDKSKRNGNVKFFSQNTNTIYRPYIEVGIDDYKFSPYVYKTKNVSGSLNTGSLETGSLDTGSLNTGSLESGSLESGSITVKALPTDIEEVKTNEINVFVENVNETYSKSDIHKIIVGVREKFPKKKFTNRMRYTSKNITTKNISFSVVDAETEEVIIDHSEYTKISCDKNGHYFKFNFGCLSRGRMYKFVLQLNDEGFRVKYDDTRTFMVIS